MGLLDERANLAGKVAVIVGGAAGIGAAVTTALAGAGVDVAFCDIKAEALETTRAAVDKLGRRVLTRSPTQSIPSSSTNFTRRWRTISIDSTSLSTWWVV